MISGPSWRVNSPKQDISKINGLSPDISPRAAMIARDFGGVGVHASGSMAGAYGGAGMGASSGTDSATPVYPAGTRASCQIAGEGVGSMANWRRTSSPSASLSGLSHGS